MKPPRPVQQSEIEPVMEPPVRPTSDPPVGSVKNVNSSFWLTSPVFAKIAQEVGKEIGSLATIALYAEEPGNVISTAVSVPVVTSTVIVPENVPEKGSLNTPSTLKVVIVSALAKAGPKRTQPTSRTIVAMYLLASIAFSFFGKE